MKKILYYLSLILSLTLFGGSVNADAIVDSLTSLGNQNQNATSDDSKAPDVQEIDEEGYFTNTEEVARYLHTYKTLPSNYITKRDALRLGLFNSRDRESEVDVQLCIGGDVFYNNEEILEEAEGRIYYECDVNYSGGKRGSERLIYSNDGLIYYTPDHYETVTLLYGDELLVFDTAKVA